MILDDIQIYNFLLGKKKRSAVELLFFVDVKSFHLWLNKTAKNNNLFASSKESVKLYPGDILCNDLIVRNREYHRYCCAIVLGHPYSFAFMGKVTGLGTFPTHGLILIPAHIGYIPREKMEDLASCCHLHGTVKSRHLGGFK